MMRLKGDEYESDNPATCGRCGAEFDRDEDGRYFVEWFGPPFDLPFSPAGEDQVLCGEVCAPATRVELAARRVLPLLREAEAQLEADLLPKDDDEFRGPLEELVAAVERASGRLSHRDEKGGPGGDGDEDGNGSGARVASARRRRSRRATEATVTDADLGVKEGRK